MADRIDRVSSGAALKQLKCFACRLFSDNAFSSAFHRFIFSGALFVVGGCGSREREPGRRTPDRAFARLFSRLVSATSEIRAVFDCLYTRTKNYQPSQFAEMVLGEESSRELRELAARRVAPVQDSK